MHVEDSVQPFVTFSTHMYNLVVVEDGFEIMIETSLIMFICCTICSESSIFSSTFNQPADEVFNLYLCHYSLFSIHKKKSIIFNKLKLKSILFSLPKMLI